MFRIEKIIKRNGDKLYVNLKNYDNSFNIWIDKMSCFLPYSHSKIKIKVKLDLSNYATISNLKKQHALIHHNSIKR